MANSELSYWYTTHTNFSPKLPVIVRLSGWEATDPMHSFGPNIRDFYLLHYIVKGKGKFCINKQTHNLSAGDGFIIPPGVVTYYEADKDDPWEYYWVGWDGENAQSVLDDINFTIPQIVFHCPDTENLIRDYKTLFTAYEEKYNPYKILSCFYSLISNIVTSDFYVKKEKYNSYLSSALLFIRINYSENITVKDIAKNIFLSVTHLNRLFRTHLNVSVKKYLNDYRLEKAIELMGSSNMNITEIALACGFGDSAYFSKSFRKKTGEPPYKFRKGSFL